MGFSISGSDVYDYDADGNRIREWYMTRWDSVSQVYWERLRDRRRSGTNTFGSARSSSPSSWSGKNWLHTGRDGSLQFIERQREFVRAGGFLRVREEVYVSGAQASLAASPVRREPPDSCTSMRAIRAGAGRFPLPDPLRRAVPIGLNRYAYANNDRST